jgi:hypothetical protein
MVCDRTGSDGVIPVNEDSSQVWYLFAASLLAVSIKVVESAMVSPHWLRYTELAWGGGNIRDTPVPLSF